MVEPLGRQLPWRAIHTRQALSRTDHAGPMPVFVFDFAFVSIFVAMFFVTQKQIYFKISGITNLILVIVARIAAPHKLRDVEADGGCARGRGGGDHPKVMIGGRRGGGGRGVGGCARVFHAAQVLRHAQQVVTRVVVFGKESQEVVLLVAATLAGRRGHQVVEVGGRRTHPLAAVQT